MGAATWEMLTPTGATGPVAIIEFRGDVNLVANRLGVPCPAIGGLALVDLMGIDRGLVTRWAEDVLQLMPHGGRAVLRAMRHALENAGPELSHAPLACLDDPSGSPEALEQCVQATLAMAASPLAIDVLLAQPERWRGGSRPSDDLDALLGRLVRPPLVVAMGPPNIGKSSLLNALAGSNVSLVADEPGTTRDHVGVLLDLAGVAIRWVDLPGFRDAGGSIEGQAIEIARHVIDSADLILSCGDHATPLLDDSGHVRVALRADLGLPTWKHDVAVSARVPSSMREFVGWLRESLVPQEALDDPRPWRFWTGADQSGPA